MKYFGKIIPPSTFRLVISIIALTTCLTTFSSAIISMVTKDKFIKYEIPIVDYDLPPTFIVDSAYDVPSKRLGDIKNSWIFAIISFIESFYRKAAISKKQLNLNQYVSLSGQYLMTSLREHCNKTSSSKFCLIPSLNYTTDNAPLASIFEFLRKDSTLTHAFIPESICPYQGKSSKEFVCDGFSSRPPSKNGFTVNLKAKQWTDNPDDIKQLLYRNEKPILFSMPEPMREIYHECQDHSLEDDCISKSVHCPPNNGFNATFCYRTEYPAKLGSGEYYVTDLMQPGEPQSFVIVGYTDDYIPTRNRLSVGYMDISTGGFIARGFNGEGHSIDFLLGKISLEEEIEKCNLPYASQFWMGGTQSCLESGKISECAPDATYLNCTDSDICNSGQQYIMIETPLHSREIGIRKLEGGFYEAAIYDVHNGISKWVADVAPERLGEAFLPINKSNVPPECGYSFIPYAVVERMTRIGTDSFNKVMGILTDVSFGAHTLPKDATGKTRTLIEQNTKAAPKRFTM